MKPKHDKLFDEWWAAYTASWIVDDWDWYADVRRAARDAWDAHAVLVQEVSR